MKPGKGHAQAHTQESALKADGAESASLLPHRCLKTERTLIAPNCHWTDTFMSPHAHDWGSEHFLLAEQAEGLWWGAAIRKLSRGAPTGSTFRACPERGT